MNYCLTMSDTIHHAVFEIEELDHKLQRILIYVCPNFPEAFDVFAELQMSNAARRYDIGRVKNYTGQLGLVPIGHMLQKSGEWEYVQDPSERPGED